MIPSASCRFSYFYATGLGTQKLSGSIFWDDTTSFLRSVYFLHIVAFRQSAMNLLAKYTFSTLIHGSLVYRFPRALVARGMQTTGLLVRVMPGPSPTTSGQIWPPSMPLALHAYVFQVYLSPIRSLRLHIKPPVLASTTPVQVSHPFAPTMRPHPDLYD